MKTQMKKLVGLLFLVLVFSCNNSSKETKTEKEDGVVAYQCPMDCENGKTYNKPGKCAVCEMDLEKKIKHE